MFRFKKKKEPVYQEPLVTLNRTIPPNLANYTRVTYQLGNEKFWKDIHCDMKDIRATNKVVKASLDEATGGGYRVLKLETLEDIFWNEFSFVGEASNVRS